MTRAASGSSAIRSAYPSASDIRIIRSGWFNMRSKNENTDIALASSAPDHVDGNGEGIDPDQSAEGALP
jgi:hypothetical protein